MQSSSGPPRGGNGDYLQERKAKASSQRQTDAETGEPQASVGKSDESEPGDRNEETRGKDDHWTKYLYNVKITDVLLALFTALLVAVGGFQAFILRSTDQAIKNTAEAEKGIRNIVSAANRPWIEITSVNPVKVTISKTGIAFSASLSYKNVGRSPALDIATKAKALPYVWKTDELLKQRDSVCVGKYKTELAFHPGDIPIGKRYPDRS